MREQDGTLRKAKGDERDRLNQIYFPQQGRKVKLSKIHIFFGATLLRRRANGKPCRKLRIKLIHST